MAAIASTGLMSHHTVFAHSCAPELPFQNGLELRNFTAFKPASKWKPMLKDRCLPAKTKILPRVHASSMGRNHIQLKFDDDYHQDPSFLHYLKVALRAMRTLFVFLTEQPRQLKYLEWPGLQSTLKTATLTLVLVALLIVALSSVDSFLSLLLALILRRKV